MPSLQRQPFTGELAYGAVTDCALTGSSGWTRRHQWATASTSWRISSRVPSSCRSTCSSKSPEACGTSTCGSGTTMAPMRPSTPRKTACAFAEPDLPRTAPINATGLLRSTLRPVGREAQSMALASTPGTAPLYSGVAIRTAFDPADWLRVPGGLDVLVEERQLADIEELHLDPLGRNLLCGAQ